MIKIKKRDVPYIEGKSMITLRNVAEADALELQRNKYKHKPICEEHYDMGKNWKELVNTQHRAGLERLMKLFVI